jgi:hypothetical protein
MKKNKHTVAKIKNNDELQKELSRLFRGLSDGKLDVTAARLNRGINQYMRIIEKDLRDCQAGRATAAQERRLKKAFPARHR